MIFAGCYERFLFGFATPEDLDSIKVCAQQTHPSLHFRFSGGNTLDEMTARLPLFNRCPLCLTAGRSLGETLHICCPQGRCLSLQQNILGPAYSGQRHEICRASLHVNQTAIILIYYNALAIQKTDAQCVHAVIH